MSFLVPFIPFIVYLIISLVKKEFNPIKWFKKEGDDVIIETIKFVSGTDKESAISNYTEKIFMIVVIEKKNTDVSTIDIVRQYGNKKQTITLKSDETEAVFEIGEDEELTEEQEITIDYRIKDKPVQFITNSETIKLDKKQVETIETGETIKLQISNKPDVNILETKTNTTFVDVTLEEDPEVNIFGSSNVYFNPLLDRKNFYIIKDGIKQGIDTGGKLSDNGIDNIFTIIKYGNHQYIGDVENRILYLDNDEIKIKDMETMSKNELLKSKIKLKFSKKNIITK